MQGAGGVVAMKVGVLFVGKAWQSLRRVRATVRGSGPRLGTLLSRDDAGGVA